jgi:hypothetical protein
MERSILDWALCIMAMLVLLAQPQSYYKISTISVPQSADTEFQLLKRHKEHIQGADFFCF